MSGNVSTAVHKAMKRGLCGFSIPGSPSQTSDVLLNVDTYDLPARWLITLLAFKYRAGTLAITGPGGGTFDGVVPSADNQIEVVPAWKALIQWGSGGVSEQALVDYPARGTSIALTAASIRLQLFNNGTSGGATIPRGNLAGFLAPADISRDSVIQPPTLTSGLRTLNSPGAGGSTFVDIPARAAGYRPHLPGSNAVYYGTGQNLYQTDGAGNRIVLDILNWGSAGAPASEPAAALMGNSLPWYPLHPQAQLIEINTASTTQQSVIIQFVLDIA